MARAGVKRVFSTGFSYEPVLKGPSLYKRTDSSGSELSSHLRQALVDVVAALAASRLPRRFVALATLFLLLLT